MKTRERYTKGRVRSEITDVIRRLVQGRSMSDAELVTAWRECYSGFPDATPTREEAVRGIAIHDLYRAMAVLGID